jgi:hypothetical protein
MCLSERHDALRTGGKRRQDHRGPDLADLQGVFLSMQYLEPGAQPRLVRHMPPL